MLKYNKIYHSECVSQQPRKKTLSKSHAGKDEANDMNFSSATTNTTESIHVSPSRRRNHQHIGARGHSKYLGHTRRHVLKGESDFSSCTFRRHRRRSRRPRHRYHRRGSSSEEDSFNCG